MSLKIFVSGAASVSIRIERATRVEVDASGGVRIDIGDGGDGVSVSIGSRARGRRGAIAGAPRIAAGASVTPAMELAAVEAFLAGADVTRLGRSLTSVYTAMEAVRRGQDGEDDGGD